MAFSKETLEKDLIYKALGYTVDLCAIECLDVDYSDSHPGTQKIVQRERDKIASAEAALTEYELTGFELVSGRGHHKLIAEGDVILAVGQTCCNDREYGCAYLDSCKATAPKYGIFAIKRQRTDR